ncbi:hypothetical protein cypCar_00038439 [Cyprinus carpio]|nr:hypothetical protein cypCar_00038439 [Cyprinus carpio]
MVGTQITTAQILVLNRHKIFTPRALRWMQTMIFAVREINQREDLLPNLSLGYHIKDSGDDISVSVKRSLLLVNGQPEKGNGQSCEDTQKEPSPVIVGEASSGISMAVLRSLGSFKIPLVSYFASCSCLSNKREFPAFMRTMPSDLFQVKALVKLVHYFQWTWVGVIGVDTDYARFAIQLFLKESENFNICPAYVHLYPVALTKDAAEELVKTLKSSSATVIISFTVDSYLHGILKECRRQNVTHLQWIASEAWATSKALWDDFGDLLMGTLGFAIRRADIPQLGSYLRRVSDSVAQKSHFLSEFWEETFHCRLNGSLNTHMHGEEPQNWPLCNGSESLDDVYTPYSDVSQLRVSYNVYKAVYLIAHALHDMSTCEPGKGPFQNGTCGSLYPIVPWQLMKNILIFPQTPEEIQLANQKFYSFDNIPRVIGNIDGTLIPLLSPVSSVHVSSITIRTNKVKVKSAAVTSSCNPQGDFNLPVFVTSGDFTIGGIFPLHYRVELPPTDYIKRPLAAQCQ